VRKRCCVQRRHLGVCKEFRTCAFSFAVNCAQWQPTHEGVSRIVTQASFLVQVGSSAHTRLPTDDMWHMGLNLSNRKTFCNDVQDQSLQIQA
jgi:hypothetical protein